MPRATPQRARTRPHSPLGRPGRRQGMRRPDGRGCGQRSRGPVSTPARSQAWKPTMAVFEEGNGSPLQYSCLENPMDRGA